MWDKYIVTMASVEVYTDIYFSHALFAHVGGCLVLFLNLSFQRILFSEVGLQRTRNENSPVGSIFLKKIAKFYQIFLSSTS